MKKSTAPAVMILTLFLITGCAGIQPVQRIAKGEQVYLDYTCRTGTQEIISTTDPAVAANGALKKSRVFRYPNDYQPGPVTAGMERLNTVTKGPGLLELEIYYRLSRAVVGLEKEKEYEVVLESKVPEGLADNVRFQVRPTVYRVSKYKFIPRYQYDEFFKSPPEIGMILKNDFRELGKITAFDEKFIHYEMSLIPGEHETSLGPATHKAEGDVVITQVKARVGTLVRWNRAIGKIVDVTDKAITIDYGHPFGGETLQCKVRALSHNPYPETEHKIPDAPEKQMNSED